MVGDIGEVMDRWCTRSMVGDMGEEPKKRRVGLRPLLSEPFSIQPCLQKWFSRLELRDTLERREKRAF